MTCFSRVHTRSCNSFQSLFTVSIPCTASRTTCRNSGEGDLGSQNGSGLRGRGKSRSSISTSFSVLIEAIAGRCFSSRIARVELSKSRNSLVITTKFPVGTEGYFCRHPVTILLRQTSQSEALPRVSFKFVSYHQGRRSNRLSVSWTARSFQGAPLSTRFFKSEIVWCQIGYSINAGGA